MTVRSGHHIVSVALSRRTKIKAEARIIGRDIVVIISGGDQPHIGSVAIAIPRPSMADPSRMSATCSCFNFIGHKDDCIAKTVAEKIAIAAKQNTVVTAGIHIDDIQDSEIKDIVLAAESLAEQLIRKLHL